MNYLYLELSIWSDPWIGISRKEEPILLPCLQDTHQIDIYNKLNIF